MSEVSAESTAEPHLQIRTCPSFLSWSVVAGIIGFVLVDALDVSAPLVVLLGAVLGVIGWATNMH